MEKMRKPSGYYFWVVLVFLLITVILYLTINHDYSFWNGLRSQDLSKDLCSLVPDTCLSRLRAKGNNSLFQAAQDPRTHKVPHATVRLAMFLELKLQVP